MLNTLFEQMIAEFDGQEVVPQTFYELSNGTYIYTVRDSAGNIDSLHFGKLLKASTPLDSDEAIFDSIIWRGFEFLSKNKIKYLAFEEIIESLNAIGLSIKQGKQLYEMFQSDMSFCEIQEQLTKKQLS